MSLKLQNDVRVETPRIETEEEDESYEDKLVRETREEFEKIRKDESQKQFSNEASVHWCGKWVRQ